MPGLGQDGAHGICGVVGEDDEGGLPVPGTGGLRGTGVVTRLRQAGRNGTRPEPSHRRTPVRPGPAGMAVRKRPGMGAPRREQGAKSGGTGLQCRFGGDRVAAMREQPNANWNRTSCSARRPTYATGAPALSARSWECPSCSATPGRPHNRRLRERLPNGHQGSSRVRHQADRQRVRQENQAGVRSGASSGRRCGCRGRRVQGVEAPAKASIKRARFVAIGTAAGAVEAGDWAARYGESGGPGSALTKVESEEYGPKIQVDSKAKGRYLGS